MPTFVDRHVLHLANLKNKKKNVCVKIFFEKKIRLVSCRRGGGVLFFSSNGDGNQPSHVISTLPPFRGRKNKKQKKIVRLSSFVLSSLTGLPFFFFFVFVCVSAPTSLLISGKSGQKKKKELNPCVQFLFSIRLDAGHDTPARPLKTKEKKKNIFFGGEFRLSVEKEFKPFLLCKETKKLLWRCSIH